MNMNEETHVALSVGLAHMGMNTRDFPAPCQETKTMEKALSRAIRNLFHPTIKALLRAGASPDFSSDPNGVTLAHLAAQGGNMIALKALMFAGADLNRKDDFGNTPSDYALSEGHQHLATWLTKQAERNDAKTASDLQAQVI